MSEQSTTTTTAPEGEQQQQAGASGASAGSQPTAEDVQRLQQALANEREATKRAKQEAKELRSAKDELDQLRASSMTEQEKAVAQARIEGKTEALKTATSRLVQANVEAVAAGKLADPSDAVAMIDLEQFEVDDNGNVDRKAIVAAIDKLIAKKPYLAGRTGGSFDGGARSGSASSDDDMNLRLRRAAGRE